MSIVKLRREKLLNSLDDNSLVIFYSSKSPIKSGDERYLFSPNRNFFYFTNLAIENSFFVIYKTEGEIYEKLFIERNDPILARWIGEKPSKEECSEKSEVKINNIYYIDEFFSFLGNTLWTYHIEDVYFYLKNVDWENNTTEKKLAKEITYNFPYVKIKDVSKIVNRLRVKKDETEIENIKKAISITQEAIIYLMQNAKPGMYEYELEAYFDFILRKNGVTDFAFKPIVASGINSTILHYSSNNCKTNEGDLVLLDLGAQYQYYSADISRTFPISRKFTDRQKEIYQVVLNTMKEVQNETKPGITLFELNEIAKKSLAKGCKEINLINSDEELSKYYFHSISHFLGLDTHDVGGKKIKLEPGMVITNEPGLYIPEEKIGIRIEDDLLITENGCENLSKDIPKEIYEIENIWGT
ncbi:MAG TPA: aminopeptidase P family protein [Defluviitoga sp.]|nr:aminopeptidase P family protein [Defluviitoga sp.]HOP24117.1 aminopeptidase P family protein [Defluviitoga sp.]HPZ28549.1 aminopeptidase P family protein [Defluviitoga sp.]HQD62413.1 aminopeptidase P family protein [Defluviitoga sp.]